MGVYAVTGGSHGIGANTVELLKKEGHEVVNIDLLKGDITADLTTLEGRQKVIDELHELHPEGFDGLILSAAVSGACGNLTKIISLNYFGAVSIIKGTYDLLEKKHGSCVAVSSNIISQDLSRMDIADLLNNCGDDEHKIRSVVSSLDASDLSIGNSIYAASKYALARWVRRHSASYAANGVRINAVAPGNVGSAMTATMSHSAKSSLNALPIPTRYGQETFMDPKEIALAIVFLASEKACGINGIVMFVDGGTDALLNTEKVY